MNFNIKLKIQFQEFPCVISLCMVNYEKMVENLGKPTKTHFHNMPFYLNHDQFLQKVNIFRDIIDFLRRIFSKNSAAALFEIQNQKGQVLFLVSMTKSAIWGLQVSDIENKGMIFLFIAFISNIELFDTLGIILEVFSYLDEI
jgi:hypothetical protein